MAHWDKGGWEGEIMNSIVQIFSCYLIGVYGLNDMCRGREIRENLA